MGTMTMVCYALGYTRLIFLSSLFTGLVKQSRGVLQYSEGIIRLGSVALILTGMYYLVIGSQWLLASA
jgi:cytochrome c-type biogenesis protein